VVPPAPVELPELRYEYQPTDEQGRNLGGKQVIKYKTPDELANKLRDQNVNLVRKLREVTRKQKLGLDDDQIPAPATAELQPVVEFAPRDLTVEERFNLSQDLQDPAKSVEAVNTMVEASIGMSPAKLRETFNAQQMLLMQLQAMSNYSIFEANSKDSFYPCQENKQVLTDWMTKKGLSPTVENFKLALSKLSEVGLLLDSPIVREVTPAPPAPPAPVAAEPAAPSTEPNPQVPAAPESRITPTVQPQAKRPAMVPSGLNARTAPDSSPASPKTTRSLADIDRMSADEYKKALRDPVFKKLVEDLDRQAAAKRRPVIDAQ
jgi:hypothetical protein